MAAGKGSTGLMQATPGDMKSLRSSAERIALILDSENANAQRAAGNVEERLSSVGNMDPPLEMSVPIQISGVFGNQKIAE